MNRKKLLIPIRWLALLLLLCGSCQESTVENQQDGIVLKVQTQGTQLSLINAITLERPGEGPALGRVRSITVLKDYIIVVDATRERVEVFGKGGRYKWPIGSRGDREGLYKIPSELAVIPNTDHLLLYDGGTGQTLRFSIQGEFLGHLKLSERRYINRMLVSDDHKLIHTYVDKNQNGMLCVTSLETGKDIVNFKVNSVQYGNLFLGFKRFQGLAYDEVRNIIYFALPWEEKIMRIDLAAQEFLTSIVTTHPKFISLKLDEVDDSKDIRELSQQRFSKLYGMHLLSSGDMLLRYTFEDLSMSTALILLSDLDTQPSAQEVNNELIYSIFTCHENSIYAYSPPTDGEDTNGRIRVYRLTESQEGPTGQ